MAARVAAARVSTWARGRGADTRIFRLLWDTALQAEEVSAYFDLRGLSIPPMNLRGLGNKSNDLQNTNFDLSVTGLIMIRTIWMDG